LRWLGCDRKFSKELEAILRSANAQMPAGFTMSLLALVKPLFQFVKKLPASTTRTKRLTSVAQAVLQTSRQLKNQMNCCLPQASSMVYLLSLLVRLTMETATTFRTKLVAALHEIRLRMTAY